MSLVRHSIKKQYSLVFGLLLVGAVLLIGCFNFFTLERFYMRNKQKVLINAYMDISHAAREGDIQSDQFEQALKRCADINNISVLILDSDKETIKSTERDSSILTNRLLDHIFQGTDNDDIVYQDSKIQVMRTSDPNMSMEYLELWGVLPSNSLILMRSPVQSMEEASVLANKVLFGACFGIVIVGVIVIWIVTHTLTKPIMNLVEISEKMTNLDFSEKFSVGSGTEIDVLGQHINVLSENLEKTISELKCANNELQKDIDRRTELDEMRQDFVSDVSHELKTPIALIQGYAEGLKDCVNDDAESREFYCDVIIDESMRMNNIVRNLLDLNELEFGTDNVDMNHFNIIELIHNCALAFDLMIKNQNIKLILPESDMKVLVWADEFKVEHIFNNYLSNAIHYVKNENLIDVKVAVKDSIVRISVFNTGDNIPEDVIPMLWNKFYKVDKARTREYGGSGIGLSIVKASMDAMRHEYGVINHDNGVEFWFEVDANNSIDI